MTCRPNAYHGGRHPRDLGERFWEKVARGPGCWEWTSSRQPLGYGTFGIKGRTVLAHRVAWELTNGPIPEGMNICHRCDNPPCCNPDHLFLGTFEDNARDRAAKGRNHSDVRRGTGNGRAKLTEAQVIEMRNLYADGGITQKTLAARYGVSPALVSFIVTRTIWQHV